MALRMAFPLRPTHRNGRCLVRRKELRQKLLFRAIQRRGAVSVVVSPRSVKERELAKSARRGSEGKQGEEKEGGPAGAG